MYTKRGYIISNGHKIGIHNGRKIYQHFQFQGPPKYTQIGILGMKINHLATLIRKKIDFLQKWFFAS
jgi:hypothetical protein